jgi:alpha-ketoglutarate-dependent taurine dioxygenase
MINAMGAQEGRMKPVVTKSGAACGAEIACDLAQDIDEPTFGEIERTFHDNIVVVFRRQTLSNERILNSAAGLASSRSTSSRNTCFQAIRRSC